MKHALGILTDGATLRAALVSTQGSRPQIEALETFTLYDPLEKREVIDQQSKRVKIEESRFKNQDPFDLNDLSNKSEDYAATGGSNNNIDVIIKMVSTMCPHGCQIAFTLSDHFTVYKHLPAINESTENKLRKILWQTFTGDYHNEPQIENIGYLQLPDKTLFTLLHEDPLVLSSLLMESFSLMQNTPPKVQLVDSTEFVLAHEIIHSYNLTEQDHSAVILFTTSHTKIFFMRGVHIHTVLPTIYEGSESETVCDTALAKILFEFDSGKLAILTRVILVGEVDRVRGEFFFKDKWPSANVTRLEIVRAILTEKLEILQGRTSPYAVPIALALKALDESPKYPYQHNFLPRRIREKQSVYRVAWHGMLLLFILFISAMFITIQSIKSLQVIHSFRAEQSFLGAQLLQLANVANQVDSLRAEIAKMEVGTAIIDSLNNRSTRWAPLIEAFSQAYEKSGPFSFNKLETVDANHMTVETEMLHEEQVVNMERLIRQSMVTNVKKAKDLDDRYITVQFICDTKKTR